MTNYTRIGTCAATGENVAIAARQKNPEMPVPDFDAREYLGPDSSWDQRRAFEWGVLAITLPSHADYCHQRIAELKSRNP